MMCTPPQTAARIGDIIMFDIKSTFQHAPVQAQHPEVSPHCASVGRDNWIGELDFSANQAPGAQSGWLSMLADALPCSSFPGVWG